MRVIFVPIADRSECAIALDTAFTLAKSTGASVIGCHIRPHRHSPVKMPSMPGMSGISSEDAEWQIASAGRYSKATSKAARALFAQVAEQHGYELRRRPGAKPSAVWMEKTGSPRKVIGIMGPLADLLVVSRPARKGGTVARLFMIAALLASSRPVLVLPQTAKRSVGRRICIAWDQSHEAARAVAAAMPLLTAADSVTSVSCGPETRPGPKSGQLATYLRFWGIKSSRLAMPGKHEAREILDAYKSVNADLLVMGAYSRSRMSQLIFGGVTDYMLKRASIPVLMLHT